MILKRLYLPATEPAFGRWFLSLIQDYNGELSVVRHKALDEGWRKVDPNQPDLCLCSWQADQNTWHYEVMQDESAVFQVETTQYKMNSLAVRGAWLTSFGVSIGRRFYTEVQIAYDTDTSHWVSQALKDLLRFAYAETHYVDSEKEVRRLQRLSLWKQGLWDARRGDLDRPALAASTTVPAKESALVRESDHFAYPASKRKEIVQHFNQDKASGKVQTKGAWAHTNYGITGKTLKAYQDEFAEET